MKSKRCLLVVAIRELDLVRSECRASIIEGTQIALQVAPETDGQRFADSGTRGAHGNVDGSRMKKIFPRTLVNNTGRPSTTRNARAWPHGKMAGGHTCLPDRDPYPW